MASLTPDTAVHDAPAKPLRADAQRNYDKLIAAAREAFSENGSTASLDDIAKRAGVGPGTLYRHFPTRDDLIDALMRTWADSVVSDSRAAIAAGGTARETLRTWFAQFIGHLTLHRGTAAKLSAAMDDPSSPIYRKCQVLASANADVLQHVAAGGGLRSGVEPKDVMRLVSGIANVSDAAAIEPDAVLPMLDIVIDGILREPAGS